MDKNKFTIVPVYGTVTVHQNNDNNIVSQAEDSFDLSAISLGQLVNNLKVSLNKKPSMFIFLRKRENEKIALTNEKIRLVIEQVGLLQSLGRNLLDLQADAIFSSELLHLLVNEKRENFAIALRERVAEHETFIHDKEHERNSKDMDLKEREHKMRMDELRTNAEVAALNARTTEQTERANLFKEVAEIIKNMSPVLQSNTLNSIFGNSPIDFTNPIYDEKIKEIITKKHEEEWRKANIENNERERKHEENKKPPAI